MPCAKSLINIYKMSILISHVNGWIISHSMSSQLVLNVDDTTDTAINVRLQPTLFNITSPFKKEMKTSKTRKKKTTGCAENQQDNDETTQEEESLSKVSLKVKTLSEEIIREGMNSGIFTQVQDISNNDNSSNDGARKIARDFYETVRHFQQFSKFMIENENKNLATKTILFDAEGNFHNFILPPSTKVYCDSMDNARQNLVQNFIKYSLIILDPPWSNKFVRRRKRKQQEAGYYMMENKDIENLPIKDLTNEGALVVIWCTNKEAHQNQIIKTFFPSWDVDYVTTWYWLKVTTDGRPICPFNSENLKQPYETIIIGRKRNNFESIDDSNTIKTSLSADTKVIISVPSSIHSHKPPLMDILRQYMDNSELNVNTCCELFARYALPNCTSYGNEVLKLMHESLYTKYLEK